MMSRNAGLSLLCVRPDGKVAKWAQTGLHHFPNVSNALNRPQVSGFCEARVGCLNHVEDGGSSHQIDLQYSVLGEASPAVGEIVGRRTHPMKSKEGCLHPIFSSQAAAALDPHCSFDEP
jgi:hypothetical protein